MKRIIVLVAALGLSALANAQTGVTLTNVLDTATDNGGVNVYAASYSVADNKFLSSSGGTAIRLYNGNTGAYESNLNISGITISGLGFFALTSGTDGSIFAFTDTTALLYQWDNVADVTPTQVAATVPFSRCGHVIGTGNNTKVALTGESDSGPIYIYSTTDDLTYTQVETIPGSALPSKCTFAINTAMDKGWAVGDTADPVSKATKSGTWANDALFVPPAGTLASASLVYDNVNNVLFAFQTTTIYALHADTGTQIGSATVTNGINSVAGYAGGVVSSSVGSGTLWFAGRGTTPTNAVLQKFTYTVTGGASVQDWSIY